MRFALPAALAMLVWSTPGCYSAGAYGHAPRYVELSEETTAAAGAREYDPVMVERQPEEWRKGRVSLFGVVDTRTAGPGGQALLKLSVRRLDPRNLCVNEHDDDTCRVTVSDKDFGVVYALVTLRGDDDVGPRAVGQRSLVRIVGTVGQDVSPSDGAPIIHTTFARHWPAYFYVTRASAGQMRQ
ncbi:MAG: hypothetical protein ABSE49_07165 [Polyangiaceae bacterium]|jgi:hypothetical protein